MASPRPHLHRGLPLAALATALCAAGLAGCSYLQPMSTDSMSAPIARTRDGHRLDLDDGAVLLRPGRGEIEQFLGVRLAVTKDGVVVQNRLDPKSKLQPGDRIRVVASDSLFGRLEAGVDLDPALDALGYRQPDLLLDRVRRDLGLEPGGRPDDPAFLRAAEVALRQRFRLPGAMETPWPAVGLTDALNALPPDAFRVVIRPDGGFRVRWRLAHREASSSSAAAPSKKGAARRERGVAGTLAALRLLPDAVEVRSIRDLRPFTAARGWGRLLLGVERAGEERLVKVRLRDRSERVDARPYRQRKTFRRAGFEVVELGDWPASRMPAYSPLKPSDDPVLVTFVADGSPAAIAGLRPLDVLSDDDGDNLVWGHGAFAEVYHADGRRERIRCDWTNKPPTDLWFPFLFSYQADGMRTHVGLGPLDWLFHYSQKATYDADADTYDVRSRWSFATTLQRITIRSESGDASSTRLDPINDQARLSYVEDLFE